MAATWKLEFPYRRSVGPVIGAFLAGLRDRRVLGARTAAGRVLVPPLEYDPDTGEATVGDGRGRQSGVVEHVGVGRRAAAHHPLDRPFAWALVQLDGADTTLLHALDCGLGRSRGARHAGAHPLGATRPKARSPTSSASSRRRRVDEPSRCSSCRR